MGIKYWCHFADNFKTQLHRVADSNNLYVFFFNQAI